MSEQAAQLLRMFAAGSGAGIGAVAAFFAAMNPDALAHVAASWPGVVLGLGCGGIFVLDRRFGHGITAVREMAAAQQGLTGAVEQLVKRDDQRAREQDLMLDYLGTQTEKILNCLADLKRGQA